MIVILSPAKSLDFESATVTTASSDPEGAADADYLVSLLQTFSVAKLKALLGVSDKLASLNYDRYAAWSTQKQKPCVFSYDGPAYKSLQASSMLPEDLAFANAHVRIISGLYGVLKPLDWIKPYRLEMSSKLENCKGKDLYKYWHESTCSWLSRDVQSAPEGQRFLVNCASQEYAKAVNLKALGVPVYQMTFPGPGLFAKAARGAMVRYMVLKRVRKPEDLKSFNGDKGEWSFDQSKSSETEFVFIRSIEKKTCSSRQQANGTSSAKRQRKT